MYCPHVLDRKLPQLLKLYQTDMSLRQIAQKLHVGQTTLNYKIKELGLHREARRRRKKIDMKLFKELLQLGVPSVQIAKKLHIGVGTVLIKKKELGIMPLDESRAAYGKKGVACRSYYKKTGTRPECPTITNKLEQFKDEIIPLLENGTPRTEIAKKYGVCRATVHNFINLYGIKAPVRKPCDGKEPLIRAAFEAGASIEDISKKLNCHMRTAYCKIREMKLTRSQSSIQRKSLLNNQEAEIKKLYDQGISGTEIAKRLGVLQCSIYDFIHRKQFAKRPNVHRSIFDGHDDELTKMRQDGMTLKQIGDYFGVGANTVSYRLQKLSSISTN